MPLHPPAGGRARLAATLTVLVVACAPGSAVAQSARRASPADVAAARAAFAEGIAGVSRNPAAFEQVAPAGQGCEVAITSRRRERGDSLVERQLFDAGSLSTRMRMSIASGGGVIVFTYAAAEGGKGVSRETLRGPGGARGTSPESVREVVLLVAETSNQPDVRAVMASWAALVRACGGETTE